MTEARRTVRGRLTIVLGGLIVAFGVATAVMVLLAAPTRDPDGAVPARPTAVGHRGDRESLEAAMTALELIRPSPPKLAVDFTVQTPDGRPVRLSEYRGKVVFVNFWATWCPPCREEMPAMERLFQRNKDQGLVMLAVSVDADPKAIMPFLEEQRVSFTVGVDPKMTVASAYGVRALPASFIVDRHGYVAAMALGPRAWDDAASQALVEGLSRQ